MAPPVPAFFPGFPSFFFNARRFRVAVIGNGFRGALSASFTTRSKRALASCSLYLVGAVLVMGWAPLCHAVTNVLKYYARSPPKNLVNKDLVVDSFEKPPAVSKIAQTTFEVAF
jgi:hypothetical protein